MASNPFVLSQSPGKSRIDRRTEDMTDRKRTDIRADRQRVRQTQTDRKRDKPTYRQIETDRLRGMTEDTEIYNQEGRKTGRQTNR